MRPWLDANGAVGGLVVSSEDITNCKQVEDQLRQAATFTEAALKCLGDGLYKIDKDGLVTSMNPAAEKLFGWSFAELRGMKMHDMTHHHYRDGRPFPACECAGFQVLTHGQPLRKHEDVFIRKDGAFFDVIYTIAPLRDDDGNFTGLVVVFSDVTERKRAAEALRKSQERFSAIVASAMDAIIALDNEQKVLLFNAAAEAMFGCKAEEAIGVSIDRFIPERFRAAHRTHIQCFGESGSTTRAMGRLGSVAGLASSPSRWGRCRPHPSQTRTSGIPASGSS